MTQKLSGPVLAPASGAPPRQLIVLLHGYGANGEDLIGLGEVWAPAFPDALFAAPNAPDSCAGTAFGYQWFELDLDRGQSRVEGAKAARPLIEQFLADLWAETGLTAVETVLVGFSQGAMMALHVGLGLDGGLAGIVAFSGLLIPPERYSDQKPPVALIHGALDRVVDPAGSLEAEAVLGARGHDVALHVSPGISHSISTDGLQFATAFLNRVLPR